MRISVVIAAAVALTAGCNEVPTETVSRCYPNEGDCAAFTGENARVEPNAAVGLAVYQKICASCHGLDGDGMGNSDRGKFSDPGWQRKWSDSELSGIVTAGRGMKMPGFRLSPLELKSVVVHVRGFDVKRGKSDAVIKAKEGQGPEMPDG